MSAAFNINFYVENFYYFLTNWVRANSKATKVPENEILILLSPIAILIN